MHCLMKPGWILAYQKTVENYKCMFFKTYVTLHFLDVNMSFIFRSDVDWIIDKLLVMIPVFSVVFL